MYSYDLDEPTMKHAIFRLCLLAIACIDVGLYGDNERWAVYYNNQAPYLDFRPYELLVLDSDVHPSLNPFIAAGKTILGYISLGEIAKHNGYFADAKKESLLLDENPNWPGSYFVDVRDPRWTKMVIEELIPFVLRQRFDGLFWDTLDDAEFLERKDPEKYKGMVAAAVKLIKTIRLNYPHVPVMMNRGLDLLPQVVTDIPMVLAESIFTRYDKASKKYEKVPLQEYLAQVERLKSAKIQNPNLKIYTLDYWDPADTATIAEIYRVQREKGFIPYVSTPDLQKLIPEPAS